nr:DNA methyltransferase [Ferruginibacter sp.]
MKSKGKDLEKAYIQAKEYCHNLSEQQLPRLIMVCDFDRFIVYDEEGNKQEFTLDKLVDNIHVFALLAGYEKRIYKEQDPVNIKAAELMGELHDKLKTVGYNGHELELYLVRLLFCLFADDTNIFNEKGMLYDYLELNTKEDGSDLAAHIAELFQVLNTKEDKRFTNLDETLGAFPYVNGKLFEEQLPLAHFDSAMRKILLDSCALDWGKISPAIFGSLFQSVMDEKARRNLGAHYTSEKNILKLIKPLFLDDLYFEFEKSKADKNKLRKLHDKISNLRFIDPACGCGNFLIIAYRELRILELEIVKLLLKNQQLTSINDYFLLDVDKFYGIEYEEFPSQIAQVAMWLMDHQMNEQASLQFGNYMKRIPLTKSANIVHGNALSINWQGLLEEDKSVNRIHSDFFLKEKNPASPENRDTAKPSKKFDFILGNPPFIGKSLQNPRQKADMEDVFTGVNGAGVLDYVTAWYIKAAQYMRHSIATKTAFVSTNSIAQGEQVGVLWNELFNKHKTKIHFAHRTFSWQNEAKGNAAVHVVIIGFANFDSTEKKIYEYENIKGEPHEVRVKNINPYLVEGNDTILASRNKPICNVPEISYGSMANDGGNLLLDDVEMNNMISKEPLIKTFIKPFLGSREFINGIKRWCIWLKDIPPNQYAQLKGIVLKIQAVKDYRLKSTRIATQKLADYPMLFGEIRQPHSDYLLIPGVSSENRKYIPVGFLSKDIIASDLARTIPTATLFSFGIITSLMHMTWMKYVCGRLKSDYRYSNNLVYNNYPWPENPTDKQKGTVEKAAEQVLNARAQFPDSSLADLYDPNIMPPILVKAHQQLDKAVDICYGTKAFASEAKRMEFLFELYERYLEGMFVKAEK